IKHWCQGHPSPSAENPVTLCFRHEFRLPKKSPTTTYRLSINDQTRKSSLPKVRVPMSKSKDIAVWLNGKSLDWTKDSRDLTTVDFVRGVNWLAIEVTLQSPLEYNHIVLSACLDAVPEAGQRVLDVLGSDVRAEMKLVTSLATVCDLCSHLP